MSTTVIERLDDAQAALADDDYVRFRETVPRIFDAYDAARPAERAFTERAKSITRSEPAAALARDPSDLDEVARYVVEAQRVNANRAGAFVGLGVGVPNAAVDVDLAEFIGQLKAAEVEREEFRSEAAPAVSDATLQALPRVYDVALQPEIVAVGTEVEVTATLGNAGDTGVADVPIELGLPAGVTVGEPVPDTVSLEPSAVESVEFTLRATTTVEDRVSVAVETDGDRFAETAEIDVVAPSGLLERAGDRLTELRSRISETDADSGRKRRLLSSIDAARRHLSKAEAGIDRGNDRNAIQRVETATNQLGALLNKLHADPAADNGNANGGSRGFGNRETAAFTAIAEETIDLLAAVTRAR